MIQTGAEGRDLSVIALEQRVADAERATTMSTSLYDAAISLGAASSMRELVEIIASYVDPFADATCALLWFEGDGVGPRWARVVAATPPEQPFPDEEAIFLDECPYRSILTSADLLAILSTETDPALDEPSRRALLDRGRTSVISAPLVLRGRLVGRLLLTWSAQRAPSEHEVTLAFALARQAPAAAERLKLIADARQQLEDLQRSEEQREAMRASVIEAQEALLEELSTPTIPVAEDVLLMPLVGRIDEQRAHKIMEVLLKTVAGQRASAVILDISGVPSINASVADGIFAASRAVRLLGAEVVLTGIQPAAALALVDTMSDVRGLVLRATVQDGIAFALSRSAKRTRSR